MPTPGPQETQCKLILNTEASDSTVQEFKLRAGMRHRDARVCVCVCVSVCLSVCLSVSMSFLVSRPIRAQSAPIHDGGPPTQRDRDIWPEVSASLGSWDQRGRRRGKGASLTRRQGPSPLSSGRGPGPEVCVWEDEHRAGLLLSKRRLLCLGL